MSQIDKPAEASFLSRWSRRKVEAKMEPSVARDIDIEKSSIGASPGTKMPETPHPQPTLPAESPAREELPSIDSLTHEADFSPFMAKEVDPGLRNLAMKKLFTDPHYRFEQMDKLDIYIDDYSKPDPIPLDMLKKMNQAARLGLFDDEEKIAPPEEAVPVIAAAGSVATGADAGMMAESPPSAAEDNATAGNDCIAETDLHRVAASPGTAGKKTSA